MKPNETNSRWIAAMAILTISGLLGNSALAGAGIGPVPPCTKKYAFYPQGGNFFSDLFPVNFVDLDSGPGVLDYNCSGYANNADPTIDTAIIGGFTAQAIGVPVFAVLDGVVIETHDGEDDMNTNPGLQAG